MRRDGDGGAPGNSAETLDVDAPTIARALEATVASRGGASDTPEGSSGAGDSPPSGSRSSTKGKAGSLPSISLGFDDGSSQVPRTIPTAERAPDLAVVSLLAEGGMGAVYLAEQRSLGREVAVKCLRDELRAPAAIEAMLREAKTTGGLEHPNIVPIHALGQDEHGAPVLVMKRVQGTSWRQLIDEQDHPAWKSFDEEFTDRRDAHLHVLAQVCNALDFAHSRGVIHRDIKPDNVMIGSFGEVYVLDWGIAVNAKSAATREALRTHVVGTPHYMAPEMITGNETGVDARTDVYLLGATLHEILTGTYRHEGSTVSDVLLAAAVSAPVDYPDSVPESLATLCNAATHRDPAVRPDGVAAFRRIVNEYLRNRGSIALTVTADAALSSLRELVRAPRAPEDVLAGDEARDHMTEARFGYLQALRAWSANERARAGLEECLSYMIERELLQRNPDAAAALLREMRAPEPGLRKKVDTLAAQIAEQRRRDEQARREAREMDSSISARARVGVMAAALGVSVYLAADSTRSELRTGRPVPMSEVMSIDAVIVVAMLVGIVLARKSLLANRVSRQMTWLGLITLSLSFLSDFLVGVGHGSSRMAGMHALLVLGAGVSIGALLLIPGLWISAVLLLAGAVLAALVPVATSAVVTIATAGTLVVVVHQTLKHAKRPNLPL